MLEIRLAKRNNLGSLNCISGKGNSFLHLSKLEYQRNNYGNYIISFYDKLPAGYLFIDYSSYFHWVKSPIIEDLFVKEDFRKKGIAKELIMCAVNQIKLKGYEKASIDVEVSNDWIKNFYEKLGFFYESGPHKIIGDLAMPKVYHLSKEL